MKIKLSVAVLILTCALSVMAHTTLKTSFEYPLQARIVAVETRNSPYQDSAHLGANTYEWHMMKTVIGDTLYGLATRNMLTKRSVLGVGSYPAKKVKGGFELEFMDGNGKVQHEILTIRSEEPAQPGKVPTPAQ